MQQVRRPVDPTSRLASFASQLLDYFDRSPAAIFLPSQATMGHRRGVMFWSIVVITVLRFELWPKTVPMLGSQLPDGLRDYFAFGAVLLIAYNHAMYKLFEYRDMVERLVKTTLADFAFQQPIEQSMAQLESTGIHVPEGWMKAQEAALANLESDSRVASRLLKEMVRWPPALLLAVALFYVLKFYAPVAHAYLAVVTIVVVLIAVERFIKKRAWQKVYGPPSKQETSGWRRAKRIAISVVSMAFVVVLATVLTFLLDTDLTKVKEEAAATQAESLAVDEADRAREAELCDAYKKTATALGGGASLSCSSGTGYGTITASFTADTCDGLTAKALTRKWIAASIKAGRNPRVDEVNLSVGIWQPFESETGAEKKRGLSRAVYSWKPDSIGEPAIDGNPSGQPKPITAHD